MLFAQNDSDLQSHKEIIYAFVSKDKRFFSEYQKELTRNLPLYPGLELLLIDFAVILVENFDQLSEQDKLEIFNLDQRLKEAKTQKFKNAIIPNKPLDTQGLKCFYAKDITQVLEWM